MEEKLKRQDWSREDANKAKTRVSMHTYRNRSSFNTIKVFLAIVANRNLKMEQLDVKAAFLNSYLNEEVYMIIPRGFPDEGRLCKLRKAIYGLRQASQAWLAQFESLMKESAFSNSEVDACLYRKE